MSAGTPDENPVRQSVGLILKTGLGEYRIAAGRIEYNLDATEPGVLRVTNTGQAVADFLRDVADKLEGTK